MTTRSAWLTYLAVLAACSATEPKAPDPVDDLLGKVCNAAAQCPGVSATAAEIAACPANLRSKLGESQIAELGSFAHYAASKQTCVLDCIGTAICGRFGGGLSSISDADVLEPFQTCSASCGAAASAFRLWPAAPSRTLCPRPMMPLLALASVLAANSSWQLAPWRFGEHAAQLALEAGGAGFQRKR